MTHKPIGEDITLPINPNNVAGANLSCKNGSKTQQKTTPQTRTVKQMSFFMITRIPISLKARRFNLISRYLYALLVLAFTLCPSSALSFNNTYPIWSSLSYFERSALGDLHKARANDPQALLALYLLASGQRELSSYDLASNKIKQFITHTNKLVVDADNHEQTGRTLNTEMHRSFFHQDSKASSLKGYDASQSRLMGIFESNKFNCISSSLLYIVLARHFDLNIEGILLPSHAFVQLNIRGGRPIDIETTSPNGFDQKHDENFYREQSKDWFSERGLEPANFQEYLNRSFVSPTLLAARNMLNQHTSTSRMSIEDSSRLAEISAYIDPKNLLANDKRLYFYGTKINELITQSDWTELLHLYKITYQTVLADSRYFPEAETLQSNLSLYLSGAALAFAHDGNTEQTLEVMGELIIRGFKDPQSQHQIEDRVINATKVLLNKLSAENRYDEALLALSLIEGHLSSPNAWPDMLTWLYLRWTKDAWDKSDWDEVIAILSDYSNQESSDVDSRKILKTLEKAYTNSVIEAIKLGNPNKAKASIDECLAGAKPRICRKAELYLHKLNPRS